LLSAGLFDWAEMELRYGARTGAQAPILAVALAEATASKGDHGKSIRQIKGLAPGYLSMPLESAPESFWKLCFPLAYSETLKKYSRQRELDVNFLGALIRQESEFDTRAISRAKAYGLTQVLPATGRELAPKLGISGFRTASLYDPEINVNMGTYYLRMLIDGLGGHTEAALAAYNAGQSRAKLWLTWGDFSEPAEFVETIPFTETRTYVQTVLRNADIYKQLYQ
jgi:soluble lytic murein transglycosylase